MSFSRFSSFIFLIVCGRYKRFRDIKQWPGIMRQTYERCLDLYLAPRKRKSIAKREWDYQRYLPELPKPKDLRYNTPSFFSALVLGSFAPSHSLLDPSLPPNQSNTRATRNEFAALPWHPLVNISWLGLMIVRCECGRFPVGAVLQCGLSRRQCIHLCSFPCAGFSFILYRLYVSWNPVVPIIAAAVYVSLFSFSPSYLRL